MAIQSAMNYHIQYPGMINQHWHMRSGSYAGGDHLLTALTDGWQVEKCVQINHVYAGNRAVTIYEFTLACKGDTMVMPVITNPYVERLLATGEIEVTQAGQDTAAASDQKARQNGAA
jgi:hypothetical protein